MLFMQKSPTVDLDTLHEETASFKFISEEETLHFQPHMQVLVF